MHIIIKINKQLKTNTSFFCKSFYENYNEKLYNLQQIVQ